MTRNGGWSSRCYRKPGKGKHRVDDRRVANGTFYVLRARTPWRDLPERYGQILAALPGWGQATFASKREIAGYAAHVTREVDGGLQTIEVGLPAIVTADLRLNKPPGALHPPPSPAL